MGLHALHGALSPIVIMIPQANVSGKLFVALSFVKSLNTLLQVEGVGDEVAIGEVALLVNGVQFTLRVVLGLKV